MIRGLITTVAVLVSVAQSFALDTVLESSRSIPLAYDVDVVVVGGTTRGVAAAVAAKRKGASVFLMSERPYLGEDMCATYRLWLEEGEEPKSSLAKAIFKDGAPSLFKVKKVLDDALLEEKILFLYGCYPTDVLRDKSGRLSGMVMANRSGRQAVRAKVIIDATDRGVAARIAGAEFSEYAPGKHTFKRRVVGGEAPEKGVEFLFENVVVNSDNRRGKKPPATNEVYEYSLEIDMADGSWCSFARAEMEARSRTWQNGQVDSSEMLLQVPPDPVRSRKPQKGDWPGASKLELDALRSKGIDGLYVLGGCADVSREAAENIMSPLNGMALGERVGEEAAKEAKKIKICEVGDLSVDGEKGGNEVGEIGEMLNGLRSKTGLTVSKQVRSPKRAIPVLGEYDVVIIGGGTAGAPAAIAAARAGAKTLLVEYLDGLGGVGTMGRINRYYHGNNVGFSKEIDAGAGRSDWNIERKMEWYRKEIVDAGGEIWYRSLGCGSVLKGKRFVGAVVATPFGRGVVLANTVIDSTGNAVIPACAGLPCQEITGEHISVQGAGLPTFSPGAGYLNGDWTFIDDNDVVDMWRTLVVAKRKYEERFKGYDLGQLLTTRARRRIIGDTVITPMDIINERTYPDVVTVAKSNFDNHGFSSHRIFMISPPHSKGLTGNIPYRALMPAGYDGLLVTGLGISAHGDAMPILRMQPDVQNQGYAAGYAAALAAKEKSSVRKIDVKQLQKHLVDKGIIPSEMLDAEDSYPVSDEQMQDAVVKLASDYEAVSLLLTDPERALPMLRRAWEKAEEPEAKQHYAHVLGMLGDNTGIETLIESLKDAEWDKGWNFRGMGQYGRTTSPVDNLVIALGRTRDKRGLDVLIGMIEKLSNTSDFSHQRAVAIACETLADTKAAKPLYDLLQRPGMTGHAYTEIDKAIRNTPSNPGDTSTRRKSLPELVLARALYRCGDHKGFGESILREYANDLRGHYASHAKAVLKGGSQIK